MRRWLGMRVVEERDNYLLIEADGRWAVVERRAGRFFPVRDGAREGSGAGEPAAAAEDWSDEIAARAKLGDLEQRRRDLAERLW
jgi:hypothetical protein